MAAQRLAGHWNSVAIVDLTCRFVNHESGVLSYPSSQRNTNAVEGAGRSNPVWAPFV